MGGGGGLLCHIFVDEKFLLGSAFMHYFLLFGSVFTSSLFLIILDLVNNHLWRVIWIQNIAVRALGKRCF